MKSVALPFSFILLLAGCVSQRSAQMQAPHPFISLTPASGQQKKIESAQNSQQQADGFQQQQPQQGIISGDKEISNDF